MHGLFNKILGHGPVVEKCEEKVNEYVRHRLKRENEIVEALRKLGEATSMDITIMVYTVLHYFWITARVLETAVPVYWRGQDREFYI